MARNDILDLHGEHSDRNNSDVDLAIRLRNNDETVLSELIHAYQSSLARYVCQIMRSRDGAEDVLQDTYIHLWNTRSRIDPDRPLRHYLYRIARNRALNAVVNASARHRRESVAGDTARSDTDAPSTALEHAEFETAIRQAVDALPARCREVFILVREYEMTYAEVAALLGISASTVKTQMGRAMATLAGQLAPFLLVTMAARVGGM